MARSFVDPAEPRQNGYPWNNCTIPGYEGWEWKGDTSSDEVTGHIFAYSILAKLFNESTPTGQVANTLIKNILTYIVENNFYLIDINGKPTQWGIWNPEQLNLDPYFSDERFRMFSFLLHRSFSFQRR